MRTPESLYSSKVNSLSANPTKWSDTLKQFVGNLQLVKYAIDKCHYAF